MRINGILAASLKKNGQVVDNPNAIKSIGAAEYSTIYLKNNGDVFKVIGDEWNGHTLQQLPVSNIIQVNGGQYTNVFRDAAGKVYSSPVNSTTINTYFYDINDNPFTCDYVEGMFKNVAAIKSGEVWYWCVNPTNEDILNQGYNGFKPKKLIQPPGKYITKIGSGSTAPPSSYALLYGLASDGTLWKWSNSNTTPEQIIGGWTGVIEDFAVVGMSAIVVRTSTNQLWGWGYMGIYVGAYEFWQNPNPVNITSLWTDLGLTFPLKQMIGNYSTLHIIDANNDVYASGDNPEGTIGNGKQLISWKSFHQPYLNDYANKLLVQSPVKLNFKMKEICTHNSFVFYMWGKDMGDNWYSWGRNKARCLGNGITMNSDDEAYRSDYLNEPAPKKRTPLTTTWSVVPSVNINAVREPFAHAGVDQYLPSGTTSTTVSAEYSHQQQPTNTVTITMNYNWSFISGPNTPIINTPTNITTTISNLITGTYIIRLSVTNSASLSSYHDITINIK